MTIDRAAVLAFFSGKSLQNAVVALDQIEASLVHGSWIPKASRSAPSAIGKANLAIKIARKGTGLENLGKVEGVTFGPGWCLVHAMKYGAWFNGQELLAIDFDALLKEAGGRATKGLVDDVSFARRYIIAFAPVMAAIERLNASKPVPAFIRPGAVSPTVQATLDRMGAASIEVCPMEYRTIETVDEKGRPTFRTVCVLLWPAGTEHHTSLKGYLGCNCEACGHAIKNAFNWVPMLITTKPVQLKQAPWQTAPGKKSLWVGRDCAKRLFEVELRGDLEIVQS